MLPVTSVVQREPYESYCWQTPPLYFNIKNITAEKRLDIIKFDSKLSSENNVSSLCIKASQKLHALARIFNYMDKEKRRCLMQHLLPLGLAIFLWCVYMFHSRTLNSRINKIHEGALSLMYQNNVLYFTDLLERDNSAKIH